MAGDWIKMRGALYDHPKVIAIARALHENKEFRSWLMPGGSGQMNGQIVSHGALRGVTTGLLLKVWSAAREHGKFDGDDLVLAHSRIADLDEMAGAPGVGEAMKTVGWALEKKGVILRNFKQFNVPMTDAERQRAFRERRGESSANGVTPTSRKHRDIGVTREEKSRGIPTGDDLPGFEQGPKDLNMGDRATCGRRLPKDWELPRKWGEWAQKEQPSWTPEHIRRIAAVFKNHWLAASGIGARKVNWYATWQNWVWKEPVAKGSATARPWFMTASGIEAKAKELQIEIPKDKSEWSAFRALVYNRAGITEEMVRATQVDTGAPLPPQGSWR